MTGSGPLFLGIDGGGSVCRARISDPDGRVLGEATGGPANIATDLSGAAASIVDAAAEALRSAGLSPDSLGRLRAGLGLAGGNVPTSAAALLAAPLPFSSVAVASDAEIACLGAHGGEDGAILIVGTGSQGVAMLGGETRTVGGWGFQVSDTGSGAVLGRAAARRALLAHEGVEASSPFTEALMARCGGAPATLLAFAIKAAPRDWATLAPMVFEHAEAGDPVAGTLLGEAVHDVVRLIDRLAGFGASRIALMGGLARPYRPHLPARLDLSLVEPRGDALDGALALAARLPG
ncbi:MAG TPA: BadF/BadG/BcrA/BcrD ATPase family protein [Methylomirabilota bacterium]|nr:BadF/BadG/BcrA/BcrD ATPase family protein [Methylomirabilota bacterium]